MSDGHTDPSAPERWTPSEPELLEAGITEMEEALQSLSSLSLELESNPGARDTVHAMFRAAHNLKGVSGLLEAGKMTLLARAMEDLLEEVRQGRVAATPGLVDAVLAAADAGRGPILAAMRAGNPIDVDLAPILARLAAAREQAPAGAPPPADAPPPPPAVGAKPAPPPVAGLPVRLERINRILNLVGELVIRRTGLGERTRNLERLQAEIGRAVEALRPGRDPGPEAIQEVARHLRRIRSAFGSVCEQLERSDGALDRLLGQLQDETVRMRMVPVSELFAPCARVVRDVCRQLGKRARLVTDGGQTELDKVICDHLSDPLLHLIRNALDHGLEPPAERERAGKPAEGTLTLSARPLGGKVVLEVSDDGRGIDPGRVREAAARRGLADAASLAAMTAADLVDLLFQPGFSTAAKVTDLSGRGVGLDVVRSELAAVDGTVTVRSVPGEGTTFRLEVPLTLATLQVLFVRHRSEVFALPVAGIREVVPVSPGDLDTIGGAPRIAYRGTQVRVLPLDEVLGMERSVWTESARPVLVTADPQRPAGILVDATLHRRTVVLKSLGDLVRSAPGVLGTTILADGHVVLVLDPEACVRMPGAGAAAAQGRAPRAPAAPAAAAILLAEDSGVMRRRMAEILARAGYRVSEARDGAEALALAQSETFDLVSTDVVMPRMDGYELTRRLRELPAYQNVPILMVTSKDDELDRVRGFDAGADDYITKPVNEDAYLARVRRNLRGTKG